MHMKIDHRSYYPTHPMCIIITHFVSHITHFLFLFPKRLKTGKNGLLNLLLSNPYRLDFGCIFKGFSIIRYNQLKAFIVKSNSSFWLFKNNWAFSSMKRKRKFYLKIHLRISCNRLVFTENENLEV